MIRESTFSNRRLLHLVGLIRIRLSRQAQNQDQVIIVSSRSLTLKARQLPAADQQAQITEDQISPTYSRRPDPFTGQRVPESALRLGCFRSSRKSNRKGMAHQVAREDPG